MRLSPADEAFISRISQMMQDAVPGSWMGSDSWVRKEFLEYLKRLCMVAATYNQTDLRSSSDEQMEAVEDFNMAWFHSWQSTDAFRTWKERTSSAPLPETPLRYSESFLFTSRILTPTFLLAGIWNETNPILKIHSPFLKGTSRTCPTLIHVVGSFISV